MVKIVESKHKKIRAIGMKINFQNMCSLRKISCGLIFSMAISLVACGSDNDEEEGDNGDDG